MLNHVLVPLDGSILSRQAVDYAREHISQSGKFTLLYVHEYKNLTNFGPYMLSLMINHRDLLEEEINASEQYLKRIKEELETAGFAADYRVLRGDAPAVIAQVADEENVDAIIMTSHGRAGFNPLAPGSVTTAVLQRAKCPVYVIPGRYLSARKILEGLSNELQPTAIQDETARASVADIQADVQQLLASSDAAISEQTPALIKRLEESFYQIELDHPALAATIRHAIITLTNMGI